MEITPCLFLVNNFTLRRRLLRRVVTEWARHLCLKSFCGIEFDTHCQWINLCAPFALSLWNHSLGVLLRAKLDDILFVEILLNLNFILIPAFEMLLVVYQSALLLSLLKLHGEADVYTALRSHWLWLINQYCRAPILIKFHSRFTLWLPSIIVVLNIYVTIGLFLIIHWVFIELIWAYFIINFFCYFVFLVTVILHPSRYFIA